MLASAAKRHKGERPYLCGQVAGRGMSVITKGDSYRWGLDAKVQIQLLSRREVCEKTHFISRKHSGSDSNAHTVKNNERGKTGGVQHAQRPTLRLLSPAEGSAATEANTMNRDRGDQGINKREEDTLPRAG